MTVFDGALPPAPFDLARVARTFESLKEEGFAPSHAVRPILAAAFGNSPFLARLALREHALLAQLFEEGPLVTVEAAMSLALSAAGAQTSSDAMTSLRIAKRRAALAIALAGMINDHEIDRARALVLARMVLRENALKLYQLDR